MPRKLPSVPTLAEMKAFLDRARGYQEQFTPGFYHGSGSPNIKAFDPKKGFLSGVKEEEKIVPNVIFASPKPQFAESFLPEGLDSSYRTGSTIYPISVNKGKHFDPHTPEGSEVIKQYLINKYKKEADTYGFDEILNQKHEHYMDKLTDPINNWKLLENPEILKHLQSSGHDTFSVTEGGVKNIGIFDPKNIRGKFADYNPDEAMNPDFMKAEGGAVDGYALGGKVQHFQVGKSVLSNLGKETLSLLKKSPEDLLAARQAMTGFVQKQNPILAQATDAYRLGKISHDEFQDIIAKHYRPNILGKVPDKMSPYDIAVAIGPGKAQKGIVDFNVEIPHGAEYTSRLDIPGYEATGQNVGSIVLPSKKTVYGQAEHLGNVGFESDPTKAMRVALGTKEQALTPGAVEFGNAKSPFAVVRGKHLATDPDEIRRAMEFYTGAPEWKEIGMNPYAHSQFFDKKTMRPTWNSDEVLKYGNYVLAKDPEMTHWMDPRLAIDAEKVGGVPGIKFAGGGKIDLALELAKKIAPKFDINAVQNMPVGSAAKQAPVARAFQMLSSENVDPAVKAKIFKDYIAKHPDLIRKSGATNYDELTQAAYEKMVKETKDQYDLMTGSGIKLDWDPTGSKGYKSSAEMLKDAGQNKHLTVFQGGEPHPFVPQKSNEQFRAVHDYFGHGTTGASFGPKGEELAYGAHSQMYSPLARLAAATETRGQNSFVNYSGINDELIKKMNEARARGASPEELQQLGQQWQYAPQKGLILPSEQVDINYRGYSAGGEIIKQALQHAKSVPFVHFSKSSNISRLEPAMYGTGIRGAEGVRLQDAPDIRPRSYFYTDRPDVRPEQGLGSHKYSGVSELSYPLHEDPAGFYKLAKELAKDQYFAKQGKEIVDQPKMLNEVERAIKKAGYTGYHTDDAGILFNPTEVKKITE